MTQTLNNSQAQPCARHQAMHLPLAMPESVSNRQNPPLHGVRIVIPVEPHGQMRARSTAIGGYTRAYKDKKQVSREETIKAFLAPLQPATPFNTALLLGVKAYLPIPASKPKKWKQDALAGIIRPTTKPDLDNLLKMLKDCLSQCGFWTDDKLVVGYLPDTGKYYSDKPRWEIEIVEYGNEVRW